MSFRVPIGAALAISCVIFLCREAQPAERTRPNILLIFSDDLTCQAISTYGERRQLLETPTMDRLGREGMRFDRCLVTNSICGPSRATILTGKYNWPLKILNRNSGMTPRPIVSFF